MDASKPAVSAPMKAASADVIEDSMSNDLCDVLANAGLMFKYTSEHLGLMYDIALILWRSLCIMNLIHT